MPPSIFFTIKLDHEVDIDLLRDIDLALNGGILPGVRIKVMEIEDYEIAKFQEERHKPPILRIQNWNTGYISGMIFYDPELFDTKDKASFKVKVSEILARFELKPLSVDLYFGQVKRIPAK